MKISPLTPTLSPHWGEREKERANKLFKAVKKMAQ